jgi:Vacuolar transporter chaperone
MFPIQPLDYVGIPTATNSSLKSSSSNNLARHRGDGKRTNTNTSTTTASGGSRRTTHGSGSKHHHDRHLGVEVLMGHVFHHTTANQRDDQQQGGGNNEVEEEEEGGIEIMKCDKLGSDIESCSKVKTSTRRTTACRCCSFNRRNSKDSSYLHESTDSCSSSSYYEDSTNAGDSFVDRSKEILQVKNNKQKHIVDPSVVLSLERTLFAALNNAWLLAIGGVGLMSVGHGDQKATNAGIVILVGGIASALMAFGMHLFRVVQLRKNISFCYSQSIFWASIIALMTIVTLLLELNFGVMYPYLQREKTVTIAGDYSSNNTALN